jgi:hypothetical protein
MLCFTVAEVASDTLSLKIHCCGARELNKLLSSNASLPQDINAQKPIPAQRAIA